MLRVDNLPGVTQKQSRELQSACLVHYSLRQCFLRRIHPGKVGTIYSHGQRSPQIDKGKAGAQRDALIFVSSHSRLTEEAGLQARSRALPRGPPPGQAGSARVYGHALSS